MVRRFLPVCAALVLATGLAGCDLLGLEPASVTAARREAEGKAVGGACRHAGRAIEDCYTLNRKADKAAVFAGWREMNDYMRENKIEAVPPQLPPPGAKPPKSDDAEGEAAEGADARAAADKAEKPEKPEKGGARSDKAGKAPKPAAH